MGGSRREWKLPLKKKKKWKRRRTPCCLTRYGGCNIPGRGCTGWVQGLFEALTPSILSLVGASPVESWATSRLRLTRDALGARRARWVPGRGVPLPEAGLGREGKRILSPLPLRHGPPTGSPNLQPGRVRTAQFCQFLKPSWLRSKTKQPNPRSNSSPFLQSSGVRGVCGFVPAAERRQALCKKTPRNPAAQWKWPGNPALRRGPFGP